MVRHIDVSGNSRSSRINFMHLLGASTSYKDFSSIIKANPCFGVECQIHMIFFLSGKFNIRPLRNFKSDCFFLQVDPRPLKKMYLRSSVWKEKVRETVLLAKDLLERSCSSLPDSKSSQSAECAGYSRGMP